MRHLLVAVGLLAFARGPVDAHDAPRGRIAELEAARTARPTDARLWLTRAELLREVGDPSRALADLDRARRLDPELAEVDYVVARSELDRGRSAAAVAAATRFLVAQPDQERGYVVRARSLVAGGSPSRAVSDYDRVLTPCRREAPDPQLVLERARAVIAARGRAGVSAAIAGIESAVARVGPLVALVVELVELEVESGHYDAAVRRCDALAAALPRKAEWRLRAGRVLELAGRGNDARTRYEQAIAELVARDGRARSVAWARLEDEARASLARLDGGHGAAEGGSTP